MEIESGSDLIFEWKRKFELINSEYETFKNDAIREIDMIKDSHKSEVREFLYKIQLLNEKGDSNVDKESYRNIRSELDSYRKNFNELQAEISNLRKDKEALLIERNEIKLNLLKELDQEKLKLKMAQNDVDRTSSFTKNLENEIQSSKLKNDETAEEIKDLMNEKYSLSKEIRQKESDFENFKSEIRLLRQKVEERDKEYEDNMRNNHEKEKQRFFI